MQAVGIFFSHREWIFRLYVTAIFLTVICYIDLFKCLFIGALWNSSRRSLSFPSGCVYFEQLKLYFAVQKFPISNIELNIRSILRYSLRCTKHLRHVSYYRCVRPETVISVLPNLEMCGGQIETSEYRSYWKFVITDMVMDVIFSSSAHSKLMH
jgi:hypothetical protein